MDNFGSLFYSSIAKWAKSSFVIPYAWKVSYPKGILDICLYFCINTILGHGCLFLQQPPCVLFVIGTK